MSHENRSPHSGVADSPGPEAVQLDALDPQDIAPTAPASYMAFDLLAVNAVDIRSQRWTTRRGGWSRWRCGSRRCS